MTLHVGVPTYSIPKFGIKAYDMKLLILSTLYPGCTDSFYSRKPEVAIQSFAEQKAAIDYAALGWADYWSHALIPLGYNVLNVFYNVENLQRAWAREHSVKQYESLNLKQIAILQIKSFQPDILFFDDPDEALLLQIRSEVPSIRLVLGWSGSAVPMTNAWKYMDLILSCAQESVEQLKHSGYPATQIHHGFDPRLLGRISQREKLYNFSFIGQIVRTSQFHLLREKLLKRLANQCGITIFTSSADYGWKDDVKALLMATAYDTVCALRDAGLPEEAVMALPFISKAAPWSLRPTRPADPVLKPFMKPAVFGLEMLQVLSDSKITLNCHADSSPRFASNMRLFETTGVGTCMITDWKDNLTELFTSDTELVTYKSEDECIEKATWLLDHPCEREAIASAGQARTLREHTSSHRALLMDDIIRKALS